MLGHDHPLAGGRGRGEAQLLGDGELPCRSGSAIAKRVAGVADLDTELVPDDLARAGELAGVPSESL